MTNRRAPSRRASSDWKPPRPKGELLKAVGSAAGIVAVTALVIFLIQPGDASTTTPTPQNVSTLPAQPTGATGGTGTTGATGTTGTTATTGTTGGSENGSTTTTPAGSPTTTTAP